MKSRVVKRSVDLNGRKTSVSVEDAFWEGLKEVARKRLVTVPALIANIDATRQQPNLSSAVRVFVLEYYRSQALNEGGGGLHEVTPTPLNEAAT
jgi:predicted DNA-binding ribbon-helix-helix protein